MSKKDSGFGCAASAWAKAWSVLPLMTSLVSIASCSSTPKPQLQAPLHGAFAPGPEAATLTDAQDAQELERRLAQVRAPQATVSTALLRSLLRKSQETQGKCEDLSGQLDALKGIDLEQKERK